MLLLLECNVICNTQYTILQDSNTFIGICTRKSCVAQGFTFLPRQKVSSGLKEVFVSKNIKTTYDVSLKDRHTNRSIRKKPNIGHRRSLCYIHPSGTGMSILFNYCHPLPLLYSNVMMLFLFASCCVYFVSISLVYFAAFVSPFLFAL